MAGCSKYTRCRIAGTGGAHNSPKNYALGRALYDAGFHVVSLSSPTLPNFIVSASSTGVPGHAVHDAEDRYRVMTLIRGRLRKDAEVTGICLAGYSLGGFNAAFVSWLDDQRKLLDFKRVLLINPPVRLYESMSVLDRMLESIPRGMDNFHSYYEKMVREFSVLYSTADRLEFSEEFLYAVFRQLQPRDDELAALIGLSFRFSAANLMFTADLMTDFGFIDDLILGDGVFFSSAMCSANEPGSIPVADTLATWGIPPTWVTCCVS